MENIWISTWYGSVESNRSLVSLGLSNDPLSIPVIIESSYTDASLEDNDLMTTNAFAAWHKERQNFMDHAYQQM